MAAWRRVWRAFGAAALAIILVELALRGASLCLAYRFEKAGDGLAEDPHAVRLLCLGESTTAPTFVEGQRDYSWPAQLREILVSRYPGRRFQVINKGVPGTNTSVILAELPGYIKRYRPHVVISMAGINDHRWYGIVEYRSGVSGFLARALSSLKTWKLLRYCWYELAWPQLSPVRPGLPGGPSPEPRGALAACLAAGRARIQGVARAGAIAACRRAGLENPDDARPHAQLSNFYGDTGALPAAWEEAAAAVKLGTVNEQTLLFYAGLLKNQGRNAEFATFVPDAIARVRQAGGSGESLAHFWRQSFRRTEKGFLREAGIDPILVSRVRMGESQLTTVANYRSMAELLEARHIALVAVQYPGLPQEQLERMLAGSPAVTCVDTRTAFRQALRRGSYWDYYVDRFAGDWGHCAQKGNRLIAEAVACALQNLLDSAGKPALR